MNDFWKEFEEVRKKETFESKEKVKVLKEDRAKIIKIPLNLIHESPYQGRLLNIENSQHIKAEIEELNKSIEISGLMQPIIVRKLRKGYEIIDGHRRVLSFKKAGKQYIPGIVKQCTEKEAMILSVIGNLQRKNLNVIETAIAIQKLKKTKLFKTQAELAKSIGKEESYISDIMNTLKLDKRIIADIAENNTIKDLRILRMLRHSGKVSEGYSDEQFALYQQIVSKNLSRNKLYLLIKQKKQKKRDSVISLKRSNNKICLEILTKNISEEIVEEVLFKLKEIMDSLLEKDKRLATEE